MEDDARELADGSAIPEAKKEDRNSGEETKQDRQLLASSRLLNAAAIAAIAAATVAALATIVAAVVAGLVTVRTKNLEGVIQRDIELLKGDILKELKVLDLATQEKLKEREVAARLEVMDVEKELKSAELKMKETETKVARLDFAYRTLRDSINNPSWPVRKAAAISIAAALKPKEAESFFGAFMLDAPKEIQGKDRSGDPDYQAWKFGEFGVKILVSDKGRSLDKAMLKVEDGFRALIECASSDSETCDKAAEIFMEAENAFCGYNAAFDIFKGLRWSDPRKKPKELLNDYRGCIPPSLVKDAERLGIKFTLPKDPK